MQRIYFQAYIKCIAWFSRAHLARLKNKVYVLQKKLYYMHFFHISILIRQTYQVVLPQNSLFLSVGNAIEEDIDFRKGQSGQTPTDHRWLKHRGSQQWEIPSVLNSLINSINKLQQLLPREVNPPSSIMTILYWWNSESKLFSAFISLLGM